MSSLATGNNYFYRALAEGRVNFFTIPFVSKEQDRDSRKMF